LWATPIEKQAAKGYENLNKLRSLSVRRGGVIMPTTYKCKRDYAYNLGVRSLRKVLEGEGLITPTT
jgi:hypothetical protein